MLNYYSIAEPVQHEWVERKSRFITHLIPIESESDFQTHLQTLRKEHYKATHHCQAYILGPDSNTQKASDDGEPSGTAGQPMLQVLKQHELTNLMAVVIRYFGGTKLGTGGLIRAYAGSVSQALSMGQKIANCPQEIIRIQLDYRYIDSFNYFHAQHPQAFTLLNSQYGQSVAFDLALDPEAVSELIQSLTDRFKGELLWEKLGQRDVNIPVAWI